DQIGHLTDCRVDAFDPARGHHHAITGEGECPLNENLAAGIVFDVQDYGLVGHAALLFSSACYFSALTILCNRSSSMKEPFCSRLSICPLRRSRSWTVSSFAVSTMIGMSC